jgi:hypothetical protein
VELRKVQAQTMIELLPNPKTAASLGETVEEITSFLVSVYQFLFVFS